jgi:outer membrane receptor for Fe3+-dicitrate
MMFLTFSVTYQGFSGTTGKIAGFVKDAETGDPLPGVNLVLEGTTMGAATDVDGYYFVINVPPGRYVLRAMMMGYQTQSVTVSVNVDLTTKFNFNLKPTVMDLGETVTVTAERPLIQFENTSKRTVVTAEMIKNMPVRSVQDIMTLQSGIMEMQGYQNKIAGFDARGIDQVHVRGGRSGQIAYMVDGIYVEDAIYAGMGTSVNREAIDEVTVITGNFDAEYGEAQSAVVNIVTKEGRDYYTGIAEYNSGEIAGALGSKADDAWDSHEATASLSGPIPLLKNLTFFLSGKQAFRRYAALEYDQFTYNPTLLNDVLDNPDDPLYQKIVDQINEDVITEVSNINQLRNNNTYRYVGDVLRNYATGTWRKAWARKEDWGEDRIPYTDDAGEDDGINDLIRWDDETGWRNFGFNMDWDVSSKLSWRISPSIKIMIPIRFTERQFRSYQWANSFGETGQHVVLDETEQQGLNLTHQISPRLFYEIRASRFWKHRTYRVHGPDGHILTPGHSDLFQAFLPGADFGPQEYPGYPSTGGFNDELIFVGYDTLRDGTIAHVYDGWTNQYWTRTYQQTQEYIGNLTWQMHRSHSVKAGLQYKRHDLYFLELQHPSSAGPYPEYYLLHPVEAAVFLQDKMDFGNLIVNAGVRFDFADSKGRAWEDWHDPSSPVTTGETKMQWSPRLGISHPITDKAYFHFSYGHFFQVPDYRDLYSNQTLNLGSSSPFFGWANMDASRTIAYEIGIDQQFSDVWKIGTALWSKENNGDPGSIGVSGFDADTTGGRSPIGAYSYSIIRNGDYGSSKGIDITFEKRVSDNYFGTIEYTYSVAKANKQYSWQGYWDGDTEETTPKKEYVMPWDRTHVFTAHLGYIMPKGFGPKLFGTAPFENMTWQVIGHFSSGYPYTPTYLGQALETNSARLPWMMQIDAVIRKDFRIFKDLKVVVLARIQNLLDKKNVLSVYSDTGSPTDPGPRMDKTYTSSRYDRPHYFGPRRQINLGARIEF